jgi:hypothetical protein
MSDNKKVSAAIAAVMYYINEEQAIQMQAATYGMQPAPSASAKIPVAAASPWGMNARQTQMQMRNLMQMRTFQRNVNV